MIVNDYSQYGEGRFLGTFFSNNPPKYKVLVDIGANLRRYH